MVAPVVRNDADRTRWVEDEAPVARRGGALRLLDGDHPGREPMMKIAEVTTDRALVLPR